MPLSAGVSTSGRNFRNPFTDAAQETLPPFALTTRTAGVPVTDDASQALPREEMPPRPSK